MPVAAAVVVAQWTTEAAATMSARTQCRSGKCASRRTSCARCACLLRPRMSLCNHDVLCCARSLVWLLTRIYRSVSSRVVDSCVVSNCEQEEKNRLLKEMVALQERLQKLEKQRGPSVTSLRASTRRNKLLRESIRGQQLSLATAQCVVSELLVGNSVTLFVVRALYNVNVCSPVRDAMCLLVTECRSFESTEHWAHPPWHGLERPAQDARCNEGQCNP